jgi:hypothetical protein
MQHRSPRPAASLVSVLLAGLGLGACGPSAREAGADGDGGRDAGEGQGPGDRADGGPVGDAEICTDAVDVVFVLDVSSSMGFVLDDLGDNIAGVVAAANELSPDAHFGLVAFADNGALDVSGDLEGGRVHTRAESLEAAFAAIQATYTRADRNPGDGPGGPTTQNPICEENAPDALHLAATAFPWRDSATRVVIVATDDTFLAAGDNYGDRDGDGDTTSTSFPREGDYPALHGVADASAALRGAKIRVFSFSRLEDPGPFDFTRCGTGRRLPWADISDGWSTPYGDAPTFATATDGANFDLDAVRGGTLSLADTINDVVIDSHCSIIE